MLNGASYPGCKKPVFYKKTGFLIKFWCPHSESDGDLFLRTELFYPLNYEGNSEF